MIIIVNAGCLLTIDLIYAMQYRRNMEIRFSIQLYLVSVITTEFPRCLRNELLRWASFFFASVVGVWTRGKCAATAPPPPVSPCVRLGSAEPFRSPWLCCRCSRSFRTSCLWNVNLTLLFLVVPISAQPRSPEETFSGTQLSLIALFISFQLRSVIPSSSVELEHPQLRNIV